MLFTGGKSKLALTEYRRRNDERTPHAIFMGVKLRRFTTCGQSGGCSFVRCSEFVGIRGKGYWSGDLKSARLKVTTLWCCRLLRPLDTCGSLVFVAFSLCLWLKNWLWWNKADPWVFLTIAYDQLCWWNTMMILRLSLEMSFHWNNGDPENSHIHHLRHADIESWFCCMLLIVPGILCLSDSLSGEMG
jgi:hypothetical protein